jgi:hypothetical protein
MSEAPPELAPTERWFVRRGLPMFIEDYDNGRDVWTRALPVLVVLFLLNTVVTIPALGLNVDDSGRLVGYDGRRVVGALVTTALLLLGYVLWNRSRGRRALAAPERVDWPVLAVWLAAPAAITFAATGSWRTCLEDLAVNGLLLLVIWLVTRYALLALTWWAIRRLFTQFGDVYRLATRALPLLLLVMTVLFLSTEVWQTAGTMGAGVLWGSLAFFFVLAFLVVVGQVREELPGLDLTLDRGAVVAACQRTPLERVAAELPGLELPVAYSRRQWTNLVTATTVARFVQVAVVAALVWLFFLGFGVVAVALPVQEAWVGSLTHVQPLWEVFGDHGITHPLLRVATFMGGFSAFYVTISGASDETYRAHFFTGISESFSRAAGVRRAYLARRREAGLSAPEPSPAATG